MKKKETVYLEEVVLPPSGAEPSKIRYVVTELVNTLLPDTINFVLDVDQVKALLARPGLEVRIFRSGKNFVKERG